MIRLINVGLSLSLLLVLICCNREDIQTVGPKTVQNNGTSQLKGSVKLTMNHGSQVGSTVSIIGSSLTATTDSMGFWTLSNLDSGVYQLKLWHNGYDTLTIQQIVVDNADTVDVGIININEVITGSINSASGYISRSIYREYADKDSLIMTRCDTLYSFYASFAVLFSGIADGSRDSLPFDVFYSIDTNQAVDMSKYSPGATLRTDLFSALWGDLFYYSDSVRSIQPGVYSVGMIHGFRIEEYLKNKNIDITSNPSLKLHIVALWRQTQHEHNPCTTENYNNLSLWKYGQASTTVINYR